MEIFTVYNHETSKLDIFNPGKILGATLDAPKKMSVQYSVTNKIKQIN